MVRAIVHKDGDRTMFEVSDKSSDFGELKDGQEVKLAIVPNGPDEMSDEEFDTMIDRLIDKNREALDYLAQ